MRAVVLVGGEGTRLRPLTSSIPKPAITLVDRPFLAYMLEWLASAGVDDVVLACGFLPTKLERALGDGSRFGVRLTYIAEPEPRGTGGAVRYADEQLEGGLGERFLVLNGDVLTDIDLRAQIALHERSGAPGTIALVPVEDPSAYGLVRIDDDGHVLGFLEKPTPEEIDTDLISAGAYVLERSVLDLIDANRAVSIEREVWPVLAERGLRGFADREAYWLDIGTPERYLQGTADILSGRVRTEAGARLDGRRVAVGERCDIAGEVRGPALVGDGVRIGEGAVIGPATVLGSDVIIDSGALVERSVLLDGARVGEGAEVRGSILAPRARVGAGAQVGEDAVLGEGAEVAAGAVLEPGARLSADAADD
jgi:mannose-1-phosphate guanylyltransferase